MLSTAARRSRQDIVRTVVYLTALVLVIVFLVLSFRYLQSAEAKSYGSIPLVGPATESVGLENTVSTVPVPAVTVEPVVPALGEGGHIYIPSIGVDFALNVMASNDDQAPLDLGPSWLRKTGKPGQPGNCVIAGHRSSYGQPFYYLGELVVGDTVVITDAGGASYTYQVDRIFPVDPSQVEVMSATPDATFTLITCHPIGSSRQRLIVQGHLL